MNYMSIGDMAQTFQMRRHNVQLKEHMTSLTQELTTGVTADLTKTVSGDFMALAGIDRTLDTLKSYKTATSEAALFASSMQTALEAVQDIPGQIAPTLLSVVTTTNPAQVDAATSDARQKFFGALSTLNLQAGDRYVFAGQMTDTRPFADGETILATLQALTATETSTSGVIAAVEAWFDAPAGGGGFLDTGYLGSEVPLAPFRVGADEAAPLEITGADPAIRDVLSGLALAALVAEGVFAGDNIERSRLTRAAGEKILGADSSLAGVRAVVGTAEGYIEEVKTRNEAETTALQLARNEIVGTDPYETASALEAVTTQMETLYTLTARISRLSFADYL